MIGYDLIVNQTDSAQTFFVIQNPADDHEAEFTICMSTPAWESQGCPERVHVEMTVLQGEPT